MLFLFDRHIINKTWVHDGKDGFEDLTELDSLQVEQNDRNELRVQVIEKVFPNPNGLLFVKQVNQIGTFGLSTYTKTVAANAARIHSLSGGIAISTIWITSRTFSSFFHMVN